MKSVTIPSTLKVIEPSIFEECKGVKRIELMEGWETFGKNQGVWNKIFRDGKIEEIVFPSTLKDMPPDLFMNCTHLKTVRAPEGYDINIKALRNLFLSILRK